MKELFRERDDTRVGYCAEVLKAAEIQAIVRNKGLVGALTEVPIPEFYPALCVVDDEDYEPAMDLLRDLFQVDEEAVEGEW